MSKVLIIGGGIAGLSAGCHLQMKPFGLIFGLIFGQINPIMYF